MPLNPGFPPPEHPTASEITDDQLDLLRTELAEAQHRARTCWQVAAQAEQNRDRLAATLDRVRALHRPETDASGAAVCAHCVVYLDYCPQPEPWPCATAEALDTPSEAVTGPHSAPQPPSGPEGHPSPERPSHAHTGARTHTED